MTGQYAVVWVSGKDLYTDSDSAGNTISYTEDEVRQSSVPHFDGSPKEVHPDSGRVAIPLETLNEFFGIS